MYKARFAEIPRSVVKDYNDSPQRVTRSPWQSPPSNRIIDLLALGFPLGVHDTLTNIVFSRAADRSSLAMDTAAMEWRHADLGR